MLKRHGWWLTAVPVLAGHWLVLQSLQGLDAQNAAPQTHAGPVFQTRSIVPPPSPVAAVAAAAPPTAPTPARPKPPPARARSDAQPVASPSASTATPPWKPPETTAGTADDHDTPGPTEAAQTIDTAALDTQNSASTAEPPPDPAPPPTTESPAPPPVNPLTQALRIVRPGDTATDGDSAGGQTLPPVQLPPPTALKFDVSGQVRLLHYRAQAELVWQHDGVRYQAQQSISALFVGARMQRSTGRISAQGLLPERFSDKSRSEQAAHFNQAEGKVTFSANTPDAAIGPGAQDRLSVFLQVGGLLAAAPERYPTGTQIQLTTVSARAADRWTFTVESTETLELPAGPTPAVKLLRLPRRDYDQKAELWLAPGLGYLPVRIRLTQSNGDFADLQLESYQAP